MFLCVIFVSNHAIPYFLVGIICGPIWGSLAVRDHLRSNLEIVCGPGSVAVLGSFADSYISAVRFDIRRLILFDGRKTKKQANVQEKLLIGQCYRDRTD